MARAAKFWALDIWGGDWDGPRRRLLFKHFWAYLRTPPVPPRYLPDDTARQSKPAQQAFTAAYRARIAAVQAAAVRTTAVQLTYRPLGKNLRLLGTALRASVDRGRRIGIAPDGPATERRVLARRGHHWAPWLWARTGPGRAGGPQDAGLAWNELFQHPEARRPREETHPIPMAPRLGTALGPFSRRHAELVLKLATATRYVFSPYGSVRARAAAARAAMEWPTRPVLGIHVRRGDAASSESSGAPPARSTRRSFRLEDYLEAADLLCDRFGYRDIFVATESQDEIEQAVRLRPYYRFLWLDHDRALFPSIAGSGQFIEELVLEHPERARPLVDSAILDLCCFCECEAFVGTFNSEFSVLAWLLMIGSRGHLVPHISLSHPAPRKRLHPFAALLNLDNNCPLELYHW